MQKNNNGLSSILFAMVFSTILALLAIGFATLVRNDQRQITDQTLGFQAQYAAESAVNQVQSAIREGLVSTEQTTCQQLSLDDSSFANSGVRVPCVTWTDNAPYVSYGLIDMSPRSFKLGVDASANRLEFSWISDLTGRYPNTTNSLPSPLDSSKFAILRISIVPSGSTSPKVFYAIPTNTGGSSQYTNIADGSVALANCSTGRCTLRIQNPGVGALVNGYISISSVGQVAKDVQIAAFNGASAQPIRGVQYIVDATAIAQDVTKRVEARVSAEPVTWRPGFALMADLACKDLKIDGQNNLNGISSSNVCASRTFP